MALDAAARNILDQIESAGVKPLELLTPEEARSRVDPIGGAVVPVAEVGDVQDREIAGVPVRVYRPEGTGPFPVLQWMHGGGWVTGSIEGADATARQLCSRSGWTVVSLDYRLSPEHKFPAAVEDVLAVADELVRDSRVLAVGGTSAGGNLAAVAAQQRPDAFRLQVLIYPITDLTLGHPSVTENAEGFGLTKAVMEWYREHYVGGVDVDLRDPLVSPLHASDQVVSRCAPALLITAGYDVLRDEGLAYADRLDANGVSVQRAHYPGQIHRFYGLHRLIPAADEALDITAGALRRAQDNPNQGPLASSASTIDRCRVPPRL